MSEPACIHMPSVGDKGQRYEVRYTRREDGTEHVFGWGNERGAQVMLAAVKQWPHASGGRIIDRHAEAVNQGSKGGFG